jgi:hypothetical protein
VGGEDCVLTWGGLERETAPEVSRGHSNSSRAGAITVRLNSTPEVLGR